MIDCRIAVSGDAQAIHRIFVACGKDLMTRGMSHWETPPPIEQTQDWIDHEWMSVLLMDDEIVAAFALLPRPTSETAGFWTDDPKALYVKHLGVHPAHQHQGIGLAAGRNIEVQARERGAERLRFDATAADSRLVRLYESFGAVETGRIGAGNQICFEYVLTPPRRPI